MKIFYCISYMILGLPLLIDSCENTSNKRKESKDFTKTAVAVDPSLFLAEGLVKPITVVSKTLSNGKTVDCYQITTNTKPSEHSMGPWCPTSISDGAEKGGKWFKDGELYDVDGKFIKNLNSFYSDATWKMYDESGTIFVTKTLEDCKAAANPNVGEEYANYCVECLPSYTDDINLTYYIPVNPLKLNEPNMILGVGGKRPGGPPKDRPTSPPTSGRERGAPSIVGLAFNGVNFDPPAPTAVILAAYTIAPMDDNGGHVNPNTGYHYHAATGQTKRVIQDDGHAAMIGYAMDGYGLYEQLNVDGKEPQDLDECRGHSDQVRGYHYHVAYAGTNSFIGCFTGAQGGFEIN